MALIEIEIDIKLTDASGQRMRVMRDGEKHIGDNPTFYVQEVTKALTEFMEKNSEMMVKSFEVKK